MKNQKQLVILLTVVFIDFISTGFIGFQYRNSQTGFIHHNTRNPPTVTYQDAVALPSQFYIQLTERFFLRLMQWRVLFISKLILGTSIAPLF
ncbi:MAG: hypothetical protein ACI8PW_001146 [Methylophilaceae bacterium]|jgi:hypothetical protein